MKNIIAAILIIRMATACSKKEEQKIYTAAEAQQIVDAAIKNRMKNLEKEAAEDLEIRKTIELKSRMDSIRQVKK